ncbi:phosphatidylinositol-specific phospholipase C domain-containing protein [Bacillus sp. TH30]|uniref:phosphatidylinositol-specific phospholipase C domain-containing protein n=1 Tax=Bacillus sp. TH30 TaxID=2796395 RepID=UPI001913BAC1|nr:phosphatidylinositol-specific phospholipase C domain-containing protein [Bacillus sp. TH30]MBK5429705.1 phosphatidylinositol-specific phospholipase C domain-containing protein [Bacillus sp. TH30]
MESNVNDIEIANNEKGYSHDSNIGYSNPNWMNKISGNVKISELSIPGTHNSMSRYGGGGLYPDDYIKTQTMDLNTQLNSGIRYLDIRLRKESNTLFRAYHGSVNQNASFSGDILDKITAFLRTNPGETVFMRVKNECDGPGTGKCTDVSTTKTWAQIFEDSYYNNASYSNYFWKGISDNPTLNEVRGKIIVFSNFPTDGKRLGIPYSSIQRQDQFDVDYDADAMYAKWTAVKQHLQSANANNGQAKYLNYLSGNGTWKFFTKGAAPYFVASGYESPTAGVGKVITTHPTDKWPDYPKDFYGYAKLYGGTNILTTEWISKLGLNHTGIIAADFPGKGLIDRVIRLNERHNTGDIRYITPKGSTGLRVGFGGDAYLRNHYVVYRNGEYIGEVVNGNPYYSYWDKTDVGHDLRFENLILFTGDKIDVFVKNGSNLTLLKSQTLTVDEQEGEEVRIPDGKYRIISALNNSSEVAMQTSLSNNRYNVVLWGHTNRELNGQWNLVYDSNKKAYQLKSAWKIDEALTWTRDSINVYTSPSMGTYDEAYWILKRAGNGYLYLENKASKTVLDVTGGGTANGTNINVWGQVQGAQNQIFKLIQRNEKLEGQIDSLYRPQPGQNNRSSGNFSLGHLADGTRVQVSIEGAGAIALTFRVMEDRPADTDPTIWSNVKHGSIVTVPSGAAKSRLYIANPGGYSGNGTFKVKFQTLQN